MPTQNPRVNVVLDKPLYRSVQYLAQRDGVSLSSKVRDLLHQAMETQEDLGLAMIAEKRESTWDESQALDHDELWS